MTTGTDHTQLDLAVEGMTCGSCSARVQRVLLEQDGVADAEVNFATGQARVTTDGPVDLDALQAAVAEVGCELEPPTPPVAAHLRDDRAEPLPSLRLQQRRHPARRARAAQPRLAGAAMAFSSVSVVANSLRLRRFGT